MEKAIMNNNPHFVLVHGAGHGGWCWFKLLSLLRSAGHHATVIDLASAGTDPTKLDDVASIHHHVQPLMDLIEGIPQQQKVVLVGHSYGGLLISLAMEKFPHRILVSVFVTGYMPHFHCPPAAVLQKLFMSLSVETVMDCEFKFGDDPEMPNSVVYGHNFLRQKLYKNCSEEDLELGKLLVRPFKMFFEDLSKESVLTEAKFGSVDRVFIVCEGDEVMEEKFQRLMIEEFPPKAVKYIYGGGHMVMLSKPKQLYQHLIEVAESFSSINQCNDPQVFSSFEKLAALN
ncbi:methylesterase 10-like [Benincasa hispida]|uniref:methylesterase 10-like n=1 Tax=Benincasa hispida TaxID=102211 RepID=UPI0018FFDCD3|nr:methylesterase 10-like [Benincasa hispida]